MHVDYVDEEIVDYFLDNISDWCSEFPDRSGCMVGECVCTSNLLKNIKDEKFFSHLNTLKEVVENRRGKKYNYFYVHVVEYSGGEMEKHDHSFAEDYGFLLYLNTSEDGATFFVDGEKEVEFLPQKNMMISYDSELIHGSRVASDKKVLVCGMREEGLRRPYAS